MSSLKVLVVNRIGLIFSQNFDDADGESLYKLELNVTKNMIPEATILVFYTREHDGEIIYDQFKLELGFNSSNHVNIIYLIF